MDCRFQLKRGHFFMQLVEFPAVNEKEINYSFLCFSLTPLSRSYKNDVESGRKW